LISLNNINNGFFQYNRYEQLI